MILRLWFPFGKWPHYHLEVGKKRFAQHWGSMRVQSNNMDKRCEIRPRFHRLLSSESFQKYFWSLPQTKQYQNTDCRTWEKIRVRWKSEPSVPQQRLQLTFELSISRDLNWSSATRQSCNCSTAICVSKRIPTTQSPLTRSPFVRKLL